MVELSYKNNSGLPRPLKDFCKEICKANFFTKIFQTPRKDGFSKKIRHELALQIIFKFEAIRPIRLRKRSEL